MVESNDSGVIRIERRQIVQDLFRRYAVLIDQRPVGKLAAFGTGEYSVPPGCHSVQLRIVDTGKSCSEDLSVDVKVGETRVLRTMPLGLRNLLVIPLGIVNPDRFAPRPWIRLHLESRPDT